MLILHYMLQKVMSVCLNFFFISERSILVLIFNHCRLLKSLLSCNRFQINIFNKVLHETTLVNCAYPLAFNINC